MLLLAVTIVLLPAASLGHLVIAPGDAWELAKKIEGDGVTITDAAFPDCVPDQAGLFTEGYFDIGIEAGAVISSAYASEVEGENDNLYPLGDALGLPGSPYLDNLLKPNGVLTKDACTLHIKFNCADTTKFGFRYVFGSDQYPSYGGNQEDVMAAFLNGNDASDNVATFGGKYVSVNTVRDPPSYIDNTQKVYEVEMNGFTVPLEAVDHYPSIVLKTDNVLNIVVADGGNNTGGAWVFIEAGSLTCGPPNRAQDSTTVGRSGDSPTPINQCANIVLDYGCACGDTQCVDVGIHSLCNMPTEEEEQKLYKRSVKLIYQYKFCD